MPLSVTFTLTRIYARQRDDAVRHRTVGQFALLWERRILDRCRATSFHPPPIRPQRTSGRCYPAARGTATGSVPDRFTGSVGAPGCCSHSGLPRTASAIIVESYQGIGGDHGSRPEGHLAGCPSPAHCAVRTIVLVHLALNHQQGITPGVFDARPGPPR